LNTEEHKKWGFLHKQRGFTLKHPTESGAVAEEMLGAGVKMYLAD